jgi:hypothetical protein
LKLTEKANASSNIEQFRGRGQAQPRTWPLDGILQGGRRHDQDRVHSD